MKEQSIRFAVSNQTGQRAASWKIWTPRGKLDVYLACRALGYALKTSLHASGDWRVAYNADAFARLFPDARSAGRSRVIEAWPRPIGIAPGVTLAYRIITAHSAVNISNAKPDPNIVYIPNCPPNDAIEIDIFLVAHRTRFAGWPGRNGMNTKPVGRYSLSNGDSLWAVYSVVAMPDLSAAMEAMLQFSEGHSEQELKSGRLRAIVFGNEPDGSRVMYDCLVRAP